MKIPLCLFSAIIFVNGQMENCPSGYVAYKKKACFMFKHTIDKAYSAIEAEEICQQSSLLKGHLASIDDAEQDRWLIDVFMHDDSIQYSAWIGLMQDPENDGNYIWRDGSQSAYRHWNPGKPDRNNDDENCIHIDIYAAQNNTGRLTGWNDDFCDKRHDRVLGFLCRTPYVHVGNCDDSTTQKVFYATGWAVGASLACLVVVPVLAFVIYTIYKKLRIRA
uniref:C-type lectin domain-containing protein n=1 Tax=Romanomermis culicivorax TaxID=13658 RepID=A0A915JZ86_ROMCU